jgi:hypothetical protein
MSPLIRSAAAVASRGSDLMPRLVAPVADVVLRADLPGLPDDRRDRTVSFVVTRCDGLPSVMRLGVAVIAAVYRLLVALPGGDSAVRFLATKPLPLLGEYPRLIRSLAFALVWETWPETRPDGSPS